MSYNDFMNKKIRFHIFPKYIDKLLIIVSFILLLFSSFMIVSAEMGLAVGETDYVTSVILKQGVIVGASIIAFIFCTHLKFYREKGIGFYKFGYVCVLISLLICRLFGSSGGAYAWIKLGSVYTIQPSELAKIFIIIFAARIYSNDLKDNLEDNYKFLLWGSLVYIGVVLVIQKDLGSAVVLSVITLVALILPRDECLKKYQKWIFGITILGIVGVVFVLSPIGTAFLKNFSNDYRIARILSAANPFEYQYDQGYHLIMGLVSFATGGIFGLGYGNSIHKYMNFPSPSTDFILPVIVEETGIIGFIFILLCYGLMIFALIRYSLKTSKLSSKTIFIGVYTYIIVHFIFNVGGVSGIIPLTGVPLLVVSYGGTSTLAFFIALGLVEAEIINNRKEYYDESNSREL